VTRYILYGGKGQGSAVIEAVLNEVQADYEICFIDTAKDEHRSEAFLKINPRGQIPALQLPDKSVMTESAAMLLHIADAFPGHALIPPPGSSQRAQHDRWLLFFAVNVYEAELRVYYPGRYVADPASIPSVKHAADEYVNRHFAIFEQQLGAGPYAFGKQITVLDLFIWMLVQWADIPWLRANCPKTMRLSETVTARPAVAGVHKKHFA
jgi:GST-like protein